MICMLLNYSLPVCVGGYIINGFVTKYPLVAILFTATPTGLQNPKSILKCSSSSQTRECFQLFNPLDGKATLFASILNVLWLSLVVHPLTKMRNVAMDITVVVDGAVLHQFIIVFVPPVLMGLFPDGAVSLLINLEMQHDGRSARIG